MSTTSNVSSSKGGTSSRASASGSPTRSEQTFAAMEQPASPFQNFNAKGGSEFLLGRVEDTLNVLATGSSLRQKWGSTLQGSYCTRPVIDKDLPEELFSMPSRKADSQEQSSIQSEDPLVLTPNRRFPSKTTLQKYNSEDLHEEFFSMPSPKADPQEESSIQSQDSLVFTPNKRSPSKTSLQIYNSKRAFGDMDGSSLFPSSWELGADEQEENDAVCAVAVYNYEAFYKMPHGSANLDTVQSSSAGIAGWAACIVDEPCSSRASESQDSKKIRSEQHDAPRILRPGDEEEAMQLRVALLQSVGVDVSYKRLQSLCSDEIPRYDEDEIDCDDCLCYDSHKYGWALKHSSREAELGNREENKDTGSTDELESKPKACTKPGCSTKDNVEKAKEMVDGIPKRELDSKQQAEGTDCSVPGASAAKADKSGENDNGMDPKEQVSSDDGDSKHDDASQDKSQSSDSFVLVGANDSHSSPSGADDQRSSRAVGSAPNDEPSFVIVEPAPPRVNRSSWQWHNLVHHLQNNAPRTDTDASEGNGSDAHSGYDHCF